MSHSGLIIKSYGRQFIVQVDGRTYQAVTKSKKTEYVVGDIVTVELINEKQLQITDLYRRDNLLYRSDKNRSKIIASNIDQLVIVIAIKPSFNLNFLNSCLLAAEAQQITPIIIINKIDLPESKAFITQIIKLYQDSLNYPVIELSALNSCDKLRSLLLNKSSLLIGQSGVGKSTITNQIIPEAFTKVGELTKSENSGSHTTTNATLYYLNQNSILIDCPGLQEFGLHHLEIDQLIEYFPECRPYMGLCKFRNCRHVNEPECAIIAAYNLGVIDKERYKFLQTLTRELYAKVNY